MGVYLKGMEMPNHCGECGIEWCERWKRLIVAGMPSAKARPEDCPLVEIPSHGRLIDADAIRADIDEKRPGRSYEDAWALTVMDAAPTIIEAEEGET